MKSILVVCEGNICRSPMAQAVLAAALPGAQVRSAGLGALVGMPADATAIALMQERGLDLSGHRAQQISLPLCLAAELVLVMDTEQRARAQGGRTGRGMVAQVGGGAGGALALRPDTPTCIRSKTASQRGSKLASLVSCRFTPAPSGSP